MLGFYWQNIWRDQTSKTHKHYCPNGLQLMLFQKLDVRRQAALSNVYFWKDEMNFQDETNPILCAMAHDIVSDTYHDNMWSFCESIISSSTWSRVQCFKRLLPLPKAGKKSDRTWFFFKTQKNESKWSGLSTSNVITESKVKYLEFFFFIGHCDK